MSLNAPSRRALKKNNCLLAAVALLRDDNVNKHKSNSDKLFSVTDYSAQAPVMSLQVYFFSDRSRNERKSNLKTFSTLWEMMDSSVYDVYFMS